MKKSIFLSLLFAFGFALVGQAQTATPNATKRQIKQQKRINQGVKSGELTKKEVIQLQAQQKHVQKTKKRAKADGVVTKKERAKIARKQARASKNINRQKHDGQKRPRARR